MIELDRTNPTDTERREAAALPYGTRFVLGERISGVQQAFLDKNGFILFSKVATEEQVAKILAEAERIQGEWLAEERDEVFGVPIWRGVDHNGEP